MTLAFPTPETDAAEVWRPTIAEIMAAVLIAHPKLSYAALRGQDRCRAVARPRQMAMALVREMTAMSFPAIGRFFGGRHHTTVMHAQRAVAWLVDANPDFAATLQLVRANIFLLQCQSADGLQRQMALQYRPALIAITRFLRNLSREHQRVRTWRAAA